MQCTASPLLEDLVPTEWTRGESTTPLLEEETEMDDEPTPLAMEVELDETSSFLLSTALEKLTGILPCDATEAMTASFSNHSPNWGEHWADVSYHRVVHSTTGRSTPPQEDVMFWHRNVGFATPSPQGPYNVAWTRNRTFDDSYTIHEPIGEGGFGVVYSCRNRHNHQQRQAVKIIQAEQYNRNEIEILQLLHDGPQWVVTLQDIFFGFDRVYLVMDELQGDLLTQLNQTEYYPESDARQVARTLLEAVQFLHARGVAHRDIKPENVLVGNSPTDVKLADFGLASRFRDAQGNRIEPSHMFTMCGSVWYAAPEVFGRRQSETSEPYDERCDVWSLGVLFYVLMAGYQPFAQDSDENGAASVSDYEVIQRVKRGKFEFHGEYWGGISVAAKQLISSLLKVHPVQRCTVKEALASPWIVDK
jgi:serine/threonine protein kinase